MASAASGGDGAAGGSIVGLEAGGELRPVDVRHVVPESVFARLALACDGSRELKQRLMRLDSNHGKLTRFYLDLRQELVTGFFCSSQDVHTFAGKCREGYLIA